MEEEQQIKFTDSSRSWTERNGFSDWAMSLIWLFLGMTIFQIFAMLLAGGVYFLINYREVMSMINNGTFDIASFTAKNLGFLFITNSTWQILFLGLSTYFFVRVCSGLQQRDDYLRLKKGKSLYTFIGLAALLIVAVQPAIWFLGWINTFIPVPEVLKNMQQSQMDLIGNFLKDSDNILFALFNVAMVPAVCEEILFRGFVFRSFEKGWGVKASIILSGLLFGLYHIQLSNLFPLAFIGMILAFIAWTANSIYPAMMAHFINNGASVIIAVYYPDSAMAQLTPDTMPPIWAVLLSLLVSFYLIYLLYNQRNKQLGAPDAI